MESKLKIEAKDINLDLNKLVNKENLFKIQKTNLNNPHISIILPKSIQTKDEIEKNNIKKDNEEKKVIKNRKNKFKQTTDIDNPTRNWASKRQDRKKQYK